MAQTLQEPEILEGQFVVFVLADRLYGVDAGQVREIVMIPELEQVAGTPDFVEGVINLHGHLTAVIDLRRRYGLRLKVSEDKDTIIVIEREGMQIGIVIDRVTDVAMLPINSIDFSHNAISDDPIECISGVCRLNDESLLRIIDLEKLLTIDEVETIGSAIEDNIVVRKFNLFKKYI